MKDSNDIVEAGFQVRDQYEITFPIRSSKGSRSFRAKDSNGETVRVDLVDLASLSTYSLDDEGKPLQIDLLNTLNYPAIPTLRDNGEITIKKKKFAYLVFDFVGGETLTERLTREGPMSPFKAMPIICELLDAIGYLHDLPVPFVHNGISLDSITISYADNRERPVLTSFDQTRNIHQSRKSISAKDLSLFHAAPELLNGIFIPQSDIFSLGAVLYHLIFGVPPWYNEKIANGPFDKAISLLFDARKREAGFLQTDEVLLDVHFITTIRKALSIDPNDRFETAEDFAKALKREVVFEGPSRSDSTDVPPKRHDKKPGTGFDAIAGMDELKSILHNDVIRPITERERFAEFGIPLLNGILLYGPPGCGKTFIAERLVEEVGYDFITVKPSDLASPFVHGGQEKIGQLFKTAVERSPCVVFIDEIDAIIPSREADISHHYAGEVNEILAQLSSCGEKGVFVIAATNRPEKIDIAALRAGRFDKIVYIPQPDKSAREAMFKLLLKSRPVDLSVDFERLADLTEKYVSSDLNLLVIEASKKAEKNDSRISMEILENVIKENKPSVTSKELRKYDELKERWDSERSGLDFDSRPSIGFVLSDEK